MTTPVPTYEQLLSENAALRAENLSLRRQFGLDSMPIVEKEEPIFQSPMEPFPVAAITKTSGTDEKITLFMSLFRGREDVYAKRWYSTKTGKSGYSPVCLNEWESGLCDKK